jgi:hypothetical protein
VTPRNTDTVDALEDITDVVQFLCEAMCIGRDLEYSDDAMHGAQHVFWALGEEIIRVRKLLIQKSE